MNMTDRSSRNGAIDMLRGLVMFLMVAVNDFWTVLDVPHSLEHFATYEDGMGLSDIVFPMFLFAMGLSVPYAIERRHARGFSVESTLGHIFSRTLALLLMGTFIVNAEGEIAPLPGYNKGVYWMLMLAGFFLVWNQYPRDFRAKPWLRGLGTAILLFLAVTFRSPEGELFRAQWWGILGQIGWMYLFTAVAYLLTRERPWVLALLWGAFVLVNILTVPLREGQALLPGAHLIADFPEALHLGNGHSIIMALGGALTTLGFWRVASWKEGRKAAAGFGAALFLLLLGMVSHRFWIVSKNLGTLPWCLFVSALSVAAFTVLRLLEVHGWVRWFAPLRPAGTATLTVYMVPYLFYSFWVFLSPSIPAWLSGWTGVGKCFLFSLACIGTAALLERLHVKLKI